MTEPLPGQVEPAEIASWERPVRVLILVLLLAGFPVAMNRAIQHDHSGNHGGSDFPDFYASARYLIEHGARHPHSEMARYLPSADVPWVALAILPLPAAAALYYVLGCWSWLGLLGSIRRYLLPDVSEAARRRATLLAGLLVLPIALDGLCVGAFHIFMVWLMVAGLGRVAQNRSTSGGLLLGLAIWVKLLPGVGVGYLILKRQWKPAALALACVVVIDAALSVTAYGPQAAWQEHVTWWHKEGAGAANRQLTSSSAIDEDRLTNQSVAVILRRVLTTFGVEPEKPRNAATLANLTAAELHLVYLATLGLLGTAILIICRRPGSELSPGRWASEIALMVLATMWFSPVVWSYHPTAVTPALAIILSRVSKHPRLVWTTALLWLVAMLLFTWPLARVLGHLLWASLFLGGVLVWLARDESSTANNVFANWQ